MKLDGVDIRQLVLNGVTGAVLGLLYQLVYTYTERRVPAKLPISVEALYSDDGLVTRFNLLQTITEGIDNVALYRAIDKTDDLIFLYNQLKNNKCVKSATNYDDTLALQCKMSVDRALGRLQRALMAANARASKIVRFKQLQSKIMERLCEYQSAIHCLTQESSV